MTTPDVLIVGGGVVGAACARALAIRGVSVTMLDAGRRPGAATWAAAGMLAPFAEAESEDPFLALSVRARDVYADLAPELLAETGVDVGLRVDGTLQVAFDEEEVATCRRAVAWQRQCGFAVDWLDADELRDRVPGIGVGALGAAYSPEDGHLSPAALHEALLLSARGLGADMRSDVHVLDILVRDSRVAAVRTASGTMEGNAVVLAAGAWSGRIHGLPRQLPVEPVRGQIAALPWPEGAPPAIIYAGSGYVMERDGEALIGSTMERAGFDPTVTESGLATLRATLGRIYPSLDGEPFERSWAGLRPMSPDGRPLLGADPEVFGLWYATGHGRNGILLAALTGDLLAQMFVGEHPEHDLSALDPGRFGK
jgi:glycine oxidase